MSTVTPAQRPADDSSIEMLVMADGMTLAELDAAGTTTKANPTRINGIRKRAAFLVTTIPVPGVEVSTRTRRRRSQ